MMKDISDLNKPKPLCDANLPFKLVELIKKQGFDVKRPEKGFSDEEIAHLAKKENRVIVTFDRHFGNIWLFPPEENSGIIFIRIHPPLIETVFSALLNLCNSVKISEFKGKLFVLTRSGYRLFPKNFK